MDRDMAVKKGERLIREENIIEFDAFIHSEFQMMDHARVSRTIQELVDDGKLNQAARVWNNLTYDHSDVGIFFAGVGRFLLRVVKYVGVAGGIWFLVEKALFY